MLDSWTITDADTVWDFRVDIEHDTDIARPQDTGDVYDAEKMLTECGEEAAQWARDAVKAWRDDLWEFVVILVTPVHKESGAVFQGSAVALSGCDYGWLPGGADGKGTWTNDREYVRTAWVDQMIESAREQAIEAFGKMA
jgi:hypothetical protein